MHKKCIYAYIEAINSIITRYYNMLYAFIMNYAIIAAWNRLN